MHDPTNRLGGVDWGMDNHAVAIVDSLGALIDEFDVAHSAAGLNELCGRLLKAQVCRVAIERPDGPIVDALMETGLEVVVVSSRSIKSLRTRYGSSGNKSDRSDAYVLADCLRTDGHRWPSLKPDTPATVTLRSQVRARKDLVETRVRVANQLRAHLHNVFPGATGLFSGIDSKIALCFLERFPCASRAEWLSEKRFEAWLRSNGYSGRTAATDLYTRLSSAPKGTTGDEHGVVTTAFVAVLATLRQQINDLESQIAKLLDSHPDGVIFRSLPRAGTIRAATLLAEIGDCRARFPDPESLACLAGVAPSTRASGRHHAVTFRFAADKKLRDAICDFAGDSWRGNEWASKRYQELRAAKKRHPHAVRILARSWLHVIWRCWQDNAVYDPTKHGGFQRPITQSA